MFLIYAYAALLLAALIASFTIKRQPLRRIVRITTISLAAFTLVVIVGGVIYFWFLFGKEPPSISELQKRFPIQKQDLDTILRMSDEDSHFSRIAPTFIDRDALPGEATPGQVFLGRYMQDDPKASLPKRRWDEYRRVYSKNRIKLGIQRDKAGDAFIMLDSIGLLERGHASGYLHCDSHPADTYRFEPCISNKPSGSYKYDSKSGAEGYSFQKLDDGWYAFDQGPG